MKNIYGIVLAGMILSQALPTTCGLNSPYAKAGLATTAAVGAGVGAWYVYQQQVAQTKKRQERKEKEDFKKNYSEMPEALQKIIKSASAYEASVKKSLWLTLKRAWSNYWMSEEDKRDIAEIDSFAPQVANRYGVNPETFQSCLDFTEKDPLTADKLIKEADRMKNQAATIAKRKR